MTNIITTFGTAESFVKSALLGLGATQQDPNGRFYLDGNMVNVELSNVIAESIYIDEIFRDGQSVTEKYTTDRKAGAIRVMLDTPYPNTSRTLSYGGRKGTDGNGGVINTNPPLLPVNEEFMVYLNQMNDQMLNFTDCGKEFIPLDVMAKKIAGYSKSVAQDRSASTLAEILAYNIFRALNAGDNINTFDKTVDNAYGNLIADLNTKLDNGDQVGGCYTFSVSGRTIIGRPAFINGIFSKNSGVILNGSNLAQEMLKSYDLDVSLGEKSFVGSAFKGNFGQFNFQSAPDYIWTLAEKYLNLSAGALAHVQAIAVSFEATAKGNVVDLGVKIVDGVGFRGVQAQPLNLWGHEAFRKSQIIGDATVTTDYFKTTLGFSADDRRYPIAPKMANAANNKIVLPIYGADGAITGYQEIAEGLKPNGGNWQSGLKTVATPVANPAGQKFTTSSISVALSTATSGAEIYYTTDGTVPSANSTKYTTAITVSAATTISAIAIKAGMVPSTVMVEKYTK